MSFLRVPLFCLGIALFVSISPTFAIDCDNPVTGDYIVGASVEITDDVVNRFLDRQYASAGFPRTLSGSTQGIDYHVVLDLPTIQFGYQSLGLHMAFEATASVGGVITQTFSFEIEPTVDLNGCGISTSMVTAFLTNIPAKIQAENLPDWLENVLISAYQDLELELYPARLLDQVEPDWFRQRALNITDLGVTWRVWQDTLELKVLAALSGEPQAFQIYTYSDHTLVTSNLEAVLTSFKVYDLGGYLVFNDSPNLITVKGGQTEYGLGWPPTGIFFVIAKFETDDSVFVRKWKVFGNAGYGGNSFGTFN